MTEEIAKDQLTAFVERIERFDDMLNKKGSGK